MTALNALLKQVPERLNPVKRVSVYQPLVETSGLPAPELTQPLRRMRRHKDIIVELGIGRADAR